MRIALLVEGKTEKAFLPYLRAFLEPRLPNRMPRLDAVPYDGLIPKENKLRKLIQNLLNGGADSVVALTDVYTGQHRFENANDAKRKLRSWVGNDPRFHPHVAQYEFEAWLLPFWHSVQRLSGSNHNAPPGQPERVNHMKPPSRWISEVFQAGGKREYSKVRDAQRILDGQDLGVAIYACPELKSFVNTILTLADGETL